MIRIFTLITLLATSSLNAQTIGDGLAEMGKMQITLDGTEYTLSGLTFTEKDNSTVELSKIANFSTITATAMTIEDGAPTSPIVTLLIGPYTNDNIPPQGSFEWYNGDEIIAANVDTGLRVTVSDVVLGEDGTLSFNFAGQAVAADRKDGMMVPIEGAAPKAVSGSYIGAIAEDN